MINTYRMRVSVSSGPGCLGSPGVSRTDRRSAAATDPYGRGRAADHLLRAGRPGCGPSCRRSRSPTGSTRPATSSPTSTCSIRATWSSWRWPPTHPGHWVTACWEVACWQLGLAVSVGSGLPPSLVVTGPDWSGCVGRRRRRRGLLAAPAGTRFRFSRRRRASSTTRSRCVVSPTASRRTPQSGLALAWADPDRQLTQADLIIVRARPARRLVRPGDPWSTCRDGILTALVSGGSVVVVVGDDPARLARVIERSGLAEAMVPLSA